MFEEENSVIEVNHLVKKYGDVTAVDDISFKLEPGRIYGLLGPNGAGKSTTMNLITGYLGATSGEILIDGHRMDKEPAAAQKKIGYLPELPPLYPEMKVKEYLDFAAELKGLPKRSRYVDVLQAIELTGLKAVSGRLIRNLSKGYRQRVGLAQAVLGFPDIIILDEPTVGLDPKQIIEIRNVIRSLAKKHTVILSSHILSEVQEICEFVYIISKGKIVAADTIENLEERMSGAGEVHLLLRADADKAKVLEQMDGIRSCRLEESSRDGLIRVSIASKDGTDIREQIFYACAQHDLPVLEMRTSGNSLEDVFLEVTGEKEEEES